MRAFSVLVILFLLAGCADEELSWISIQNETSIPIYALTYSSDLSDGDWIQPGVADDFYSINCDCLDGFEYFSFYYDSLVIYMKDLENEPIKFFKDGSSINYDPLLNPFINPDVWQTRDLEKHVPGSFFESSDDIHIFDHYFSIDAENIESLHDTIPGELDPAI